MDYDGLYQDLIDMRKQAVHRYMLSTWDRQITLFDFIRDCDEFLNELLLRGHRGY